MSPVPRLSPLQLTGGGGTSQGKAQSPGAKQMRWLRRQGDRDGRLRLLSRNAAETAASHGAVGGWAGRWRCRQAPGIQVLIMAARAMAAMGSEHAPPRTLDAAPGLRCPSPAPPRPLPALPPPLTGCSGIFSSDAAFKMAAPPPGNPLSRPLQQAPSGRHLVPRPSFPPPRPYLHSENRPGRPAAFTSRLQP